MDFVLAFSKALNCTSIPYDFCNTCESCNKISHNTHPDVTIIEDEKGIKIDVLRAMIYSASSSSYEGNNKIFIIKDINKLRKEAANSILKVIEEPLPGTYFILTSNSLDVIPTILSRSILININKLTPKELGISKKEYDFFYGNVEDVMNYRGRNVDLEEIVPYIGIKEKVRKYIDKETSVENSIVEKVKLYNCINDFTMNIDYISQLERIRFAELLLEGTNDRLLLDKILNKIIITLKTPSKTEKLLEIKNSLKFNVNTKLTIKLFVLNI